MNAYFLGAGVAEITRGGVSSFTQGNILGAGEATALGTSICAILHWRRRVRA